MLCYVIYSEHVTDVIFAAIVTLPVPGRLSVVTGIDLHKKTGGPWIKYKQNVSLGNTYGS